MARSSSLGQRPHEMMSDTKIILYLAPAQPADSTAAAVSAPVADPTTPADANPTADSNLPVLVIHMIGADPYGVIRPKSLAYIGRRNVH